MESTHARQLLEAERQRLLAVRAAQDVEAPLTEPVTSNTEELSSVDQHLADIGTETFSREVDASIREEIDAELAEIDAAMRRLEDGTYGICEACGRPIEEERLEAVPWARLCVRDQALLEEELRTGGRAP
jgi:RNA polymerase-binding transcription factor DksA